MIDFSFPNELSEDNFGNYPNFSPIIENIDHFPDDFIEINFRDSFERIFQEKSDFVQKNNNRESEVIFNLVMPLHLNLIQQKLNLIKFHI